MCRLAFPLTAGSGFSTGEYSREASQSAHAHTDACAHTLPFQKDALQILEIIISVTNCLLDMSSTSINQPLQDQILIYKLVCLKVTTVDHLPLVPFSSYVVLCRGYSFHALHLFLLLPWFFPSCCFSARVWALVLHVFDLTVLFKWSSPCCEWD